MYVVFLLFEAVVGSSVGAAGVHGLHPPAAAAAALLLLPLVRREKKGRKKEVNNYSERVIDRFIL